MWPISLDNLVALIGDDERYSEVEGLARRSLTIREEALGKLHPLVASSLNNLAVVLDSTGRPKDAEPLLKRALEIRLGARVKCTRMSPTVSTISAHTIWILKDWQQAYDAFVRASVTLISRSIKESGEGQTTAISRPMAARISSPEPSLPPTSWQRHLAAKKRSRCDPRLSRPRNGPVTNRQARAIAGMSALIAAGNGDLSARVRERQDLSEQALAVDRLLISVISQPNATRSQQTEQALRAQASDIANQIRERDRSIAAQFPDYAGLVTKTPVSIEEVQRRLNPNEALLLFATTSRFTFVSDSHARRRPLARRVDRRKATGRDDQYFALWP